MSEVIEMIVGRNTPSVFTVREVARILRIGKISAYQAIERGDVPSIRIGRRILVPRMALEQMLARAGRSHSVVAVPGETPEHV